MPINKWAMQKHNAYSTSDWYSQTTRLGSDPYIITYDLDVAQTFYIEVRLFFTKIPQYFDSKFLFYWYWKRRTMIKH